MPIFYGTTEDEHKLRSAYRMYTALFDEKNVCCYDNYYKRFQNGYGNNSKKGIMFIMVAKGNVKYMEHCKKAKPVADFFTGMLKRKENIVINHFNSYDLIQEWEEIDEFYKIEEFHIINTVWGTTITNVRNFIKKLGDNNFISNLKEELSKHFDLTKCKETPQHKVVRKLIEDIKLLEEANKDIINCLDLPYCREEVVKNPVMIDILQKVMVFY
jgi:hypothetical protein